MKHSKDHKAQTHTVICDWHAECTRKHTGLLKNTKRRKDYDFIAQKSCAKQQQTFLQ